ncbi:MAG: ADP-ribosylglycohydrolase family protein [Spirochaetaceae bacterium]
MILAAAVGDVVGSIYERRPTKRTDFALIDPRARFTDDTVLTMATAEAILSGGDYADMYRRFARRYPNAGYGGNFRGWFVSEAAGPYNSFGNGSAMRVSPVGWAFDTTEEVLTQAERSAGCTHDHPEGIKGAQATALALFRARGGTGPEDIAREIAERFGYDLSRSIEDIRPGYSFDVTCQGSVPESLIAFLEGRSVEATVRLAVSLGGDSDTQACIGASVAQAHDPRIPPELESHVRERLPADLLDTNDRFCDRFRRP